MPGTKPRDMHREATRLFLGGDVMTGRGIDQILRHPVDPILYEPAVRDARAYVRLAEQANGPIDRPADDTYVWGDLPAALDQAQPDVRIVNLETSITTSGAYRPRKRIHYRMHPRNVGCLAGGPIDCCSLANNHVLDWGYEGLDETIRSLDEGGLAFAGAGSTAAEASAAAAVKVDGGRRVLVVSAGTETSGIPASWRALPDRAGVHLLSDLSADTAERLGSQLRRVRRPGDVTVVSIHWGPNWGYPVPDEHVRFAHRLVEEGVDVVHGHSSHHPQAVEIYRDSLILYGCGDLLNDYEGIRDREGFRGDLVLGYVADVEGDRIGTVRLLPFRIRRFRLEQAGSADAAWLQDLMNTLGRPFGSSAHREADGTLTLHAR